MLTSRKTVQVCDATKPNSSNAAKYKKIHPKSFTHYNRWNHHKTIVIRRAIDNAFYVLLFTLQKKF